MHSVKIIVTTEEELAGLIAREVEKCFEAKEQQKDRITIPVKCGNYTSKDLQDMFSVSTTTIWKWERKGLLKPIIVQRRKTYLQEDIALLIKQKQLIKRL